MFPSAKYLFSESNLSLKDLQYSIEIDEEGYPLISGLRISDIEILKELFENLQRTQPPEARSKLVSRVGNSWAWIDAFDEALVVQSAQLIDTENVSLKFLGDLQDIISLNDLQIDNWDRFHCYIGKSRLPSVFSKKAQAEFLNSIVKHDLNPNFSPHRSPIQNKPQFVPMWEEAYTNKNMGWDLGSHHTYLDHFVESDLWKEFTKQRSTHKIEILVPGAGVGHDAAFWSRYKELSVTALDFAPSALQSFNIRYKDCTHVNYRIEDVFKFLKQTPDSSLDIIFEHTFFCAISPLDRQKYLDEIKRVLKPAGLWLGIYFLLEHEEGPPYALTQWELREYTKEHFHIKQWHRIKESPAGRTHKELWAVFQKFV